jgi:hypothetical protein
VVEDRLRKIALVGTTGYGYGSTEVRVEHFSWDRLKKFRNLADYYFDNLNLPDVRTDMTKLTHQHHGRDVIGA